MIEVLLLDSRATLPEKSTPGAAAWDIRALLDEPLTLSPGTGAPVLVPTGFSMKLPQGFAALLLPRSGLGHKEGIVLGNLVGLVDEDYRGPVFVSLWNRGAKTVTIDPKDRVAQMLVVPVYGGDIVEVSSLSATGRGEGGFGSTGIK